MSQGGTPLADTCFGKSISNFVDFVHMLLSKISILKMNLHIMHKIIMENLCNPSISPRFSSRHSVRSFRHGVEQSVVDLAPGAIALAGAFDIDADGEGLSLGKCDVFDARGIPRAVGGDGQRRRGRRFAVYLGVGVDGETASPPMMEMANL